MMKKALTLGIAALVTVGLTVPALANDYVPTRQSEIRKALTTLNVNINSERIVFTKKGRKDLLLQSATSKMKVVGALQKAFGHKTVLPNGYRVAGWAHMDETDHYNFTFRRGDERFVASVFADGSGSKIKIWGHAYNPKLTRRVPGKPLPRRLDRPTKHDYRR